LGLFLLHLPLVDSGCLLNKYFLVINKIFYHFQQNKALFLPFIFIPNNPILLQIQTDIDLSRIVPQKVVDFIHSHQLYRLADFANLQSFCRKQNDTGNFNEHTKTYRVNHPAETVWSLYKTIHPKYAWNGSMIQYGMCYSRAQNKLVYVDEDYTGAEVGQIVFIQLKVLGGLVKLAVGHEITAVNEEEKYLETSYLHKGKSLGSQRIYLKDGKNGGTEIIHHTIYKSDSNFRDKLIYPFFHTKAITEFHSNVHRQLSKA
jgi:hypothetical protein